MKNSYIFSAVVSVLFLTACQMEGFKTAMQSVDQRSQCTPQSAFESSKPARLNHYQRTGSKIGILKDVGQSNLLSSNYELSVLVDLQCLEKGLANSLLTRPFVDKIKRDYTKFSSLHAFTLTLPSAIPVAELSRIANADTCVVGVTQETYATTSSLPNDPLFDQQTHLKSIRFHEIYDPVFTSAQRLKGEYVVAVIDTGYMLSHPDLVNQWWVNKNEIPANQIDDDLNGVVDDIHGANVNNEPPTGDPSSVNYSQHGTHVAGLIAAQVNNSEGVASVMGMNTKIMGINAWPSFFSPIGGGGRAIMSVVANAIRYAVDNGANVINMSIQGPDLNPNIEAAMIYAAERNVVVVSAAGNNSKNLDDYTGVPAYYSADIEGAIAVAASDSVDGSLNPPRCKFSNFSTNRVEIAAPGCDAGAYSRYGGWGVLSCVPTSTDPSGYGVIQGTSMASPVAAGGALFTYALLKEVAKIEQPTAALVEEVMVKGSTVTANMLGVTKDAKHLDLRGIYDYVLEKYVEKPDPGTRPNPVDCP